MRELIPVPQENISDILLNVGPKSVNVSNGYYGYQPHVHLSDTGRPNIEEAPVKMEVQNHDLEDNVQMQMKNTFWRDFDPCLKRKRQRDVAEDFGTAKKHKESSGDYRQPHFLSISPVVQNAVHLPNPTHNVPDLPRCNMGQYF
ncbi:unnamed protein product [Acanthoscelides obtectus]|uniref:Uncharacterized protein n=1 Tax=Acanthoscelides obtectus TaxID=200917 RepID=A0A9P0M4B9_ACAOB|nr:unnamed protein product [Acanthoscelides obtectus]CAK1623134.1 hypothetical protein AOBTE_LOCUS1822 [Acanthoscelides obtectus]